MSSRVANPGYARALVCGWCTVVLGLGLARFAYSALIPALITNHWFSASATAYFGGSNFAGYLLGAIVGRSLAQRWPVVLVMRVMMLVTIFSFFASAWPVSFLWYFFWRLVPGFTGGVLIVVGPAAAMTKVPSEKQGIAGGLIFSGIGLGIIVSGTVVPLLLHLGLRSTWMGLGAIAFIVMVLGWSGWPAKGSSLPETLASTPRHPHQDRNLRAVYWSYAIFAVGLVPAMLFLVDYVARDLGKGLIAGSVVWIVFGLGATFGPVFAGMLADRIGFKAALCGAFVVQAVALAGIALNSSLLILIPASFLVGIFLPGVITLVAGRLHEIVPKHHDLAGWQTAWSDATIYLSISQVVSAFGYSYLVQIVGSHAPLFLIGSIAMIVALLIENPFKLSP
jgi:predicted MFS family arabinose efflux permease